MDMGLVHLGWGLEGYCPGPALASLLIWGSISINFKIVVLASMAIFEILN
jgi:hypothetical protein